MIDLYRALVPTHHSSTLSHSLPRSLLFYTDSLYLTHHLVTLGQRFQRRALEGVEVFGLTATFLDVLFLIREAGEEVLVNQMVCALSLVRKIVMLMKVCNDRRLNTSLFSLSSHTPSLPSHHTSVTRPSKSFSSQRRSFVQPPVKSYHSPCTVNVLGASCLELSLLG